jgi:hypothetical protein
MNASQYDVCTLPVLVFLTAVIFLPVVAVHRKLFEPSHGKSGHVAGSEKRSTVFTAQYQELRNDSFGIVTRLWAG